MKSFFVQQLQTVLRIVAKAVVAKYEPCIIGVTGSVGKTSIKEAIFAALKGVRNVRASRGNFNNELGFPLTILGDWEKIEGIFFWPTVIWAGIVALVGRVKYPEVLILEYGIQKPGDMDYLLDIATPSIAVISAIGEVPVHVEFFSDAKGLTAEKAKLANAVGVNGFVVLNTDDKLVKKIAANVRGRVVTYGFQSGAQIRVKNFENLETEVRPVGITFKIEHAGSLVPVRFLGILGITHAYASAAAAGVALIFGSNLVRIADDLAKYYHPPKHRLQIVEGKNHTTIIDDSYNASPIAMEVAIETLSELTAKRKVGILGDMLELGEASAVAHQEIGKKAGKVFNVIVAIGPMANYIAEAAKIIGKHKCEILHFPNREAAFETVANLLKPGDLVLIKASRGIGLDWLVERLKAPIV